MLLGITQQAALALHNPTKARHGPVRAPDSSNNHSARGTFWWREHATQSLGPKLPLQQWFLPIEGPTGKKVADACCGHYCLSAPPGEPPGQRWRTMLRQQDTLLASCTLVSALVPLCSKLCTALPPQWVGPAGPSQGGDDARPHHVCQQH
jgi:hypothetical protein